MSSTHTTHDSILNWRFEDVLDFECALAADRGIADEAKQTRDRDIYEERIKLSVPPKKLSDRRTILRAWIEARRAEGGDNLPGEQFLTGWHTLLTIAIIAGLFLGWAVAAPALLYRGDEPVNVVDFLAGTLGLQWALLLGALLVWLLRRTSLLPARWRPLHALVRWMLMLIGAGMRRLPGERRLQLEATFGRLEMRRELYGSLAVWPLLVCTQLFAVCFNVGVLGTLVLNPLGHEKRFGWQTHYDVIRANAPRIVATLAAPWSWLPDAQPASQEVRATNFSPGDKAAKLPADAARAWQPFLFWAVGFYGLAVRGALLAFTAVKLRFALRALPFNHEEANALWRRLNGPLVKSSGAPPPLEPVPSLDAPHAAYDGSCLALVSHELTLAEDALRDQIACVFRMRLAKTLTVKIDQRYACAAQFAAVREVAPTNVVVVVPAARDPIVAVTLFLGEVVASAGGKGSVLVLLSAANPGRAKLWRDIAARERLRVDVEAWSTE